MGTLTEDKVSTIITPFLSTRASELQAQAVQREKKSKALNMCVQIAMGAVLKHPTVAETVDCKIIAKIVENAIVFRQGLETGLASANNSVDVDG